MSVRMENKLGSIVIDTNVIAVTASGMGSAFT